MGEMSEVKPKLPVRDPPRKDEWNADNLATREPKHLICQNQCRERAADDFREAKRALFNPAVWCKDFPNSLTHLLGNNCQTCWTSIASVINFLELDGDIPAGNRCVIFDVLQEPSGLAAFASDWIAFVCLHVSLPALENLSSYQRHL
jgi:hypothetical protein